MTIRLSNPTPPNTTKFIMIDGIRMRKSEIVSWTIDPSDSRYTAIRLANGDRHFTMEPPDKIDAIMDIVKWSDFE